MYTFLFDRRSLTLFVGGLAVAGVLTFAAGMLVGMKVQLPVQTVQTATFEPLSAFEGGFIKSAEALPFGRSDAGVSTDLARGSEQPGQLSPAEPTPQTERVEPAKDEPAASDPVARLLRPSLVPEPLTEPLIESVPESQKTRQPVGDTHAAAADPVARNANARPRAAEPVTRAAPSAPQASPSRPTSYFVQIGAYRLESTARGRAAALAAEGFETEVVALPRSVGGDLLAVRLGSFETREEAVARANEYVTRAPGREAIVREAS